ncbi:unnamed protein product [Polarella glacialis]|uniref:Uncharacterized protein n=1 Tax=Polarella glacialis TaxID=89957 RepID=A0A813GJW9_POLGL|nr:unnamed protein product [Polarella glacialis]CAE8638353.1 unnamed protein product [Polarella glacialis]CAE8654301.1 unnamed protein product [Polarella glacialis]
MPKSHMGWAKRTIEKTKAETDEEKRIADEKAFRQQQIQMLQLQQQQAMFMGGCMPGSFMPGNCMPQQPGFEFGMQQPGFAMPQPGFGISQQQQQQQQQPGFVMPQPGLGGNSEPSRPIPKRSGPTGPNLQRTRPSSETYYGTVQDWKGKFGWIEPFPAIEHPLAGKHGGKVYVAAQDVLSGPTGGIMGGGLTDGQMVQFCMYIDASGIGAEQVKAMA